MAKRKKTKSAKPPVVWGYVNGRDVVTEARGALGRIMPVARWRSLEETVAELRDVASAIWALRSAALETEAKLLPVVALLAVLLIDQLEQHVQSILALSPRLRADLEVARAGAA